MKNLMKPSLYNSKFKFMFLCLIILFGCIRLFYLFSFRTSYHIDEMFSYGYANSFYDPYLYKTSISIRDRGDVESENIKEWISGKVLLDYLSVDDETKFRFDSVIYNKCFDDSPSLYEIILHFVCSFFSDSFSLNYAFSINVFLFVVICFLIFCYSSEVLKSEILGGCTLVYFILSGCLTSNFLYLRIYSLFSTLTILFIYEFHKIVDIIREGVNHQNRKRLVAYLFLLFLISFLGFYTHFFFLIIAFVFTVVIEIFLILIKQIKFMLITGSVMLSSVIAYFLIYPYGFRHIFSIVSGEDYFETGYKYPYHWQLSLANKLFFSDTIGFYIDITWADCLMALGIIIICFTILFLLFFLFRKEKWFHRVIKEISHYIFIQISKFLKSIDVTTYGSLICGIVCLLIYPTIARLVGQGFKDRYFFSPMLLFLVFYTCLICKIISYSHKAIKKILMKIIIPFILFSLLYIIPFYRSNECVDEYIFDRWNTIRLEELSTDRDCYVVTISGRDLTWLAGALYKSNRVYFDLVSNIYDEEFVIPHIHADTIVLINDYNFINEENINTINGKVTFLNLEMSNFSSDLITVDDYVKRIELENNVTLYELEDWDTFVGNYKVYIAH